jgi:hypothetical protein
MRRAKQKMAGCTPGHPSVLRGCPRVSFHTEAPAFAIPSAAACLVAGKQGSLLSFHFLCGALSATASRLAFSGPSGEAPVAVAGAAVAGAVAPFVVAARVSVPCAVSAVDGAVPPVVA